MTILLSRASWRKVRLGFSFPALPERLGGVGLLFFCFPPSLASFAVSRHGREDTFRVQTRELPRFGNGCLRRGGTGELPQSSYEPGGPENPAANCLTKRRQWRIIEPGFRLSYSIISAR